VGLRAGLDTCEKSHAHRDSIPGPTSSYAVAIPATLPGPRGLNLSGTYWLLVRLKILFSFANEAQLVLGLPHSLGF
jgi:hypothetical protein